MPQSIAAASIEGMLAREKALFVQRNPNSAALAGKTAENWLRGVPMHWMVDWGTPFPLFIASARGIDLIDADGNTYLDFCLGDTGAMFGHSPAPVAEVLAQAGADGLTTMLPSPDAAVVGRLLEERFGLPFWQVTATASDANRSVLRWCRAITGRNKILVFNGCYHGAVDETYVQLKNGKAQADPALIGEPHDLTQITKVVEFNDIAALEAALAPGDVACVLAEPIMTNVGMVLADDGFHKALRDITRKTGTILIIDETHCMSSGPGGYTRANGLEPDVIVLGKPIAGGIPAAVYGFSAEMTRRIGKYLKGRPPGHSGIGTTLSGSKIQLALMRRVLETYFTDQAFAPMLKLAEELERGIAAAIKRHKAPWHVVRVGARVEFMCTPDRPRNGGEAARVIHRPIDMAIHQYLLNRGLMITPFHNMLLICPSTTSDDVARLVAGNPTLPEGVAELTFVTPKREAEAQAFLDANPDITSFHLIWTDMCGVQRGKILRRDELVPAFRDGRFFPISALVLDVTGQDVVETGMVWDDGDRDLLLWPVTNSLRRIPWLAEPSAQYIAHIHELDGTPHICDPRNLLARIAARFAELNLTPVAAVELEFYLVDRDAALAGKPIPPRNQVNAARPQHLQAYYLQDLDDFAPFFSDLYAMAAIQDLPAKTLISEYAPGQMEIVLRHRADVLKAGDEAIMLKRLIKACAEKHGFIATFMAKPYSQYSGCGMHIHVSVADEAGKNLFAAEDPLKNELLLHGVAGLKATMAEAMLVFAPNANSYRRFRRNSYAPVAANWGINNRTVSIRIPAGAAETCHIEHRPAGADANPYFVLATVLAGIHHGIVEKLDPGNPVTGNGYEKRSRRIPSNWFEAIDAFWRAPVMKEYFGEKLIDIFCTLKEVEADRFFAEPSPQDYAWYLRTI